MRTLTDIIEVVRKNQECTQEGLIYSLIALEALSTFDSLSLQRLAEESNKFRTPKGEYEESFRRWKTALNKSPKEWVGWENDPKNPECLKRRSISLKLINKFLEKGGGLDR